MHHSGTFPPPHGPPKVVAQLQARLAQLTRDKGESDGMAQILRAKLAEVEEEIFELRVDAVATRTEAEFAGREQADALRQQLAGAESRLGFLADQLRSAERTKLRAVRELEEFKERQLVENKRLEAERRRLASARRNHESVMLAASQRLRSQASHLSLSQAAAAASPTRAAAVTTTAAAIQTESPKTPPGYAQVREIEVLCVAVYVCVCVSVCGSQSTNAKDGWAIGERRVTGDALQHVSEGPVDAL